MNATGLALMLAAPLLFGLVATVARAARHALAALAVLLFAAGAASVAPDIPLVVGGTPLLLSLIARFELVFLAGVALLLLTYHWLARDPSPVPALLPPILATIAAGRLFGPQLLVAASFLLISALLASVLMISERQDWQSSVAGSQYLVLAALGGVALLFGFVLANVQALSPGGLVTVPFVVAILSVGWALLWGVAPLHFWVPTVFQRAGPASIVVAIALLGPATLDLLLQALTSLPQLVADERTNRFLVAGGLFTAVAGAVAALAPARLSRRIGYALVSDAGYAVVGIATFTRLGAAGTMAHLAYRSLVVLLLAAASAELERRQVAREPRPYAWGCLLLGALALTGVPPLGGFAANWAIYQAATLVDWRLAVALATCSLICLVGLLLGLGEARRAYPWPWCRPRPAEWFLVALGAGLALWGFAPGTTLDPLYQAASALPFLKAF